MACSIKIPVLERGGAPVWNKCLRVGECAWESLPDDLGFQGLRVPEKQCQEWQRSPWPWLLLMTPQAGRAQSALPRTDSASPSPGRDPPSLSSGHPSPQAPTSSPEPGTMTTNRGAVLTVAVSWGPNSAPSACHWARLPGSRLSW